MYQSIFKRIIDITVSIVLLIVLLPLIVTLIVVLAFQNKASPFFFQSRPGKHEKEFFIIKFKTMTDEKDLNGVLLPDNKRITPVGRFIRKTSLDELPQMINVLTGDMSLVGPRPLLFKYIPLYNSKQRKRHVVRPGITGLAQISGRNGISWTEKLKYDVQYVDDLSFELDMKILWMTILKVIKREGVNQSTERPMEPFNGKN